ncbi:MAG: nitroreductase family protein, partial [Candidatus Subteraquimicrobiales bacterium]|nr:nitroreductase family protein [Candidatus Subteraquimicrobiales bacterium]
EALIDILETACAAPSAHNSQPWKFIVLQKKSKDALAKLILGVSREERYKSFTGFYVNRLLKSTSRMIQEAPIALAVFNTSSFTSSVEKYFPYSRRETLRVMEVQSVAAAIENLLISVHSKGLGAVWLGVPLLIPQEILEDFFKTKEELMAIIPIGYPENTRTIKKKINLEKHVAFWE